PGTVVHRDVALVDKQDLFFWPVDLGQAESLHSTAFPARDDVIDGVAIDVAVGVLHVIGVGDATVVLFVEVLAEVFDHSALVLVAAGMPVDPVLGFSADAGLGEPLLVVI